MTTDINDGASLDDAIENLEKTRDIQREELTGKFHDKVDSLKPANIIRSSVSSLKSNPSLKKRIAIGAATGVSLFILKKVLPRRWAGGLQLMIVSAIVSAVVKTVLNKGQIPATELPQDA